MRKGIGKWMGKQCVRKAFQLRVNVFVIYCCITTLLWKWLKTKHTYHLHVCELSVQVQLHWVLCKTEIKMLGQVGFPSETRLGKDLLLHSQGCWQYPVPFRMPDCDLQFLASYWLEAALSSLLYGPLLREAHNTAVCFFKANKAKSLSKTDAAVLLSNHALITPCIFAVSYD